MITRNIAYFLWGFALAISCSGGINPDEPHQKPQTPEDSVIESLKIVSMDFNSGDGKHSTDPFPWSENDEIGLYIQGQNYKVSNGTVNAAGELLFKAISYVKIPCASQGIAFFPNGDISNGKLLMNYRGQVQNGTNISALKMYDFLVSPITSEVNKTMHFTMNHIGAIINLQIHVPDEIVFERAGIFCAKSVIPLMCSYDFNYNTISFSDFSKSVSVDATEIKAINGVLSYSIMVAPFDSEDEVIVALFEDKSKNTYSKEIRLSKVCAGESYYFDVGNYEQQYEYPGIISPSFDEQDW